MSRDWRDLTMALDGICWVCKTSLPEPKGPRGRGRVLTLCENPLCVDAAHKLRAYLQHLLKRFRCRYCKAQPEGGSVFCAVHRVRQRDPCARCGAVAVRREGKGSPTPLCADCMASKPIKGWAWRPGSQGDPRGDLLSRLRKGKYP